MTCVVRIVILASIIFIAVPGNIRAQSPDAAEYLYQGKLAQGEKALKSHLEKNPGEDNARFGLGTLQFFQAVERLGNSFYSKGIRHNTGFLDIPFLRLPVPPNPKPEIISYEDLRKVFSDLVEDLGKAEATLALIKDEAVKLPIKVQRIKLNLKGDGDLVLFDEILTHYAGVPFKGIGDGFLVQFDRGDVAWLRGYCHLIMAMGDAILAYDFQDLFNSTGHVFFANPQTPFGYLKTHKGPYDFLGRDVDISDIISFIHLIRFPVKEPKRLGDSREHLLKVLDLSRESWNFILAETDDDHEWIPNPKQKGVTGIPVTREMVQSWLAFIDEARTLIDGKKLIPFWRGPPNMGINLKKVFTEPKPFDLVLWIQGSGAAPFLENGPITSPDVWRRLERVFQGDLFRFGIWFN